MSWTILTKNAQWNGREGQGLANYNNKLWLIGGANGGSSHLLNDVWNSSDGKIWTKITSSTSFVPRRVFGCVVFNNKIYVIGGYVGSVGSGYAHDVWYTENGLTWTLACNAPFSKRAGHGCVVFDNKIWIIGGYDGADCNDVWYTSNGVNWTQATSNAGWAGRRDIHCTVFDNKMWVIGGVYTTGGTPAIALCDDAWYSSDGINWTQAAANITVFKRARQMLVNYDSKLFVIGGLIQNDIMQWNSADSLENNVSNEVYYTSDGINWIEVENIPWDKRASLSAIVKDDKLIVMAGGQSFLNRFYNDIWEYE